MVLFRNFRQIVGLSKSVGFFNNKCSAVNLSPRNSTNVVFHRNASIHTSNYFVRKYQLEHISTLGWVILMVPVTTLGLGFWQIQRKQWKESKIEELKTETNRPVVDIPDNINDLNNMEYRPVKVRGQFLHDKELYVGPRTFIVKDMEPQKGGVMSMKNSASGYLVITPFKLEGREEIILINRGWVPRNKLDKRTRPEGQITDTVELIGLVRKGEVRPQFTPKATGTHFLYRDLPRMCDVTGAEPFYLDSTLESTIPGGPIGGQTIVTLRNEHMSYIVTWMCLSVLTSLFWYKLVFISK